MKYSFEILSKVNGKVLGQCTRKRETYVNDNQIKHDCLVINGSRLKT